MFLFTVAAIWAVAAVTPGPNFLVAVRCALSGSKAAAYGAVAGTITGTLIWGIAGWLGVSALFAAAPMAYLVLKIIGGLYLIWLGISLLWQLRSSTTAKTGRIRAAVLDAAGAWRLGLATSLANPKSALFVASLFAAAMPPDYHWSMGLAAVAIMVAISTIWYAGVAFALSREAVADRYRRLQKRIDALVGTIFVAFGAHLVWSAR